nr:uncharacterized protein At5g43822-like [Ipomoea batatas]
MASREGFHSIVLSFEKIVRDSRQQVKGGSAQPTVKQLQQRIGIKPSLADCLDGLTILSEMHQSDVTDDLSVLQQLLVDQPNIPKEEVNLAEKMADLGTLKTATMDDDAQTRTWISWDLGMIPSDEIYSFACW